VHAHRRNARHIGRGMIDLIGASDVHRASLQAAARYGRMLALMFAGGALYACNPSCPSGLTLRGGRCVMDVASGAAGDSATEATSGNGGNGALGGSASSLTTQGTAGRTGATVSAVQGEAGQSSGANVGGEGGLSGSASPGAASPASCVGKAGMATCDSRGHLVVCNPDQTVAMERDCPSLRLCQAGVANNTCAMVTVQALGKPDHFAWFWLRDRRAPRDVIYVRRWIPNAA
jgi:hypothetical protein